MTAMLLIVLILSFSDCISIGYVTIADNKNSVRILESIDFIGVPLQVNLHHFEFCIADIR